VKFASESEAADGRLLVWKIRKHGVQIRHTQTFARAGTEIHGA
jgi:hypothetical protein